MKLYDVEKIVKELEALYPEVYFKIKYIEDEDNYMVSLSDAEVAHSDKFNLFIGEKMIEAYQNDKTFNAFFCYDSLLENEMIIKKIEFISNITLKVNECISSDEKGYCLDNKITEDFINVVQKTNEYTFFNEKTKIENIPHYLSSNMVENSIVIKYGGQNLLAA